MQKIHQLINKFCLLFIFLLIPLLGYCLYHSTIYLLEFSTDFEQQSQYFSYMLPVQLISILQCLMIFIWQYNYSDYSNKKVISLALLNIYSLYSLENYFPSIYFFEFEYFNIIYQFLLSISSYSVFIYSMNWLNDILKNDLEIL